MRLLRSNDNVAITSGLPAANMRWRRMEKKEKGECLTDESYIFLRTFSPIFVFQCVDVTKKCFNMVWLKMRKIVRTKDDVSKNSL